MGHHHHHHGSDSEVNQEAKPEVKPEVKPETHINLKVSDGSSEIFFKIKKTTPLRRLMEAFAKRQGKEMDSLRFLYDGIRIQADQAPEDLDMEDNDIIEAHREQIGGHPLGSPGSASDLETSGLQEQRNHLQGKLSELQVEQTSLEPLQESPRPTGVWKSREVATEGIRGHRKMVLYTLRAPR
nr:brain natriuretic peptide [synthetic construct]